MAFTGRTYSKGEKPHRILKKHVDVYKFLKIGRIVSADKERLTATIEWVTGGKGARIEVPLTFPYIGPSGMIGRVPEQDAQCVCGFFEEGDGKGRPLILAYLPTGLKQGLQGNVVQAVTETVSPTGTGNCPDENRIMHRFNPLSPSDTRMSSNEGATLNLNKGASVSDHLQDSIVIRPSDQAIISTSVNNFMFADGASISMGPAVRNSKTLFDGNGNRIEDTLARETTLADGREAVYIVPFGKKIGSGTQYFSEFRVDVDELCDGVLDTNDVNGISAVSTRSPVVTLAMGNYISANQSSATYGEVLRPVLFSSREDTAGSFSLISCAQNNGVDEVSSIGLAFTVHGTQSGGFLGLDKEGHLYMNLPGSSTSNPLGAGRSMSVLANGNLKEIWGMAPEDNNSWDLVTKGGIRWKVGRHNDQGENRSIDIRTSGEIYIESGQDKVEKIYGESSTEVSGIKKESINGAYELRVAGLKSEMVFGSAEGKYMADYSINTFGKFTETAMMEKQCKFGKRKTSIIAGNDELDLTLGNLTEQLKLGSRKTTVTAGNISNSITTGNFSTSVATGKYGVDVKAGNISMATKAGTARLEAKISATLAALSVVAEGTMVKLGKGPTKSGVVTGAGAKPSHFDYVTGVPLKGSVTVTSA